MLDPSRRETRGQGTDLCEGQCVQALSLSEPSIDCCEDSNGRSASEELVRMSAQPLRQRALRTCRRGHNTPILPAQSTTPGHAPGESSDEHRDAPAHANGDKYHDDSGAITRRVKQIRSACHGAATAARRFRVKGARRPSQRLRIFDVGSSVPMSTLPSIAMPTSTSSHSQHWYAVRPDQPASILAPTGRGRQRAQAKLRIH